MPTLFRFLLVVGLLAGSCMPAHSALTQLCRSAAARDDRDDPARQAVQAAALSAGWAASPRASDETLIELFLDMIAAERGASANTLDAYRRDLADFAADLERTGGSVAGADSDELRAYLGRLAKRGLAAASVARRLSAIRQLYRFLYARRPPRRRSGRRDRRAQARPQPAQGSDHQAGRRPAGAAPATA